MSSRSRQDASSARHRRRATSAHKAATAAEHALEHYVDGDISANSSRVTQHRHRLRQHQQQTRLRRHVHRSSDYQPRAGEGSGTRIRELEVKLKQARIESDIEPRSSMKAPASRRQNIS